MHFLGHDLLITVFKSILMALPGKNMFPKKEESISVTINYRKKRTQSGSLQEASSGFPTLRREAQSPHPSTSYPLPSPSSI
jgi:hypothetical protein